MSHPHKTLTRFEEAAYGEAKIIALEILELADKIDGQILASDVVTYINVDTSKLLVLADRLRALVVANINNPA